MITESLLIIGGAVAAGSVFLASGIIRAHRAKRHRAKRLAEHKERFGTPNRPKPAPEPPLSVNSFHDRCASPDDFENLKQSFRGTPGFYWICGEAGAGKTTAAKVVLSRLGGVFAPLELPRISDAFANSVKAIGFDDYRIGCLDLDEVRALNRVLNMNRDTCIFVSPEDPPECLLRRVNVIKMRRPHLPLQSSVEVIGSHPNITELMLKYGDLEGLRAAESASYAEYLAVRDSPSSNPVDRDLAFLEWETDAELLRTGILSAKGIDL